MIVQLVWVLISVICCVGKDKSRNYETGRHRVHLVSFIIIIITIYGACSPIAGYDLLILEVFLDHTQRHTTVGRTPLDE